MTATLDQLVNVRSQLVDEVLDYLDTLAERMAELPAYYPAHLRADETGKTRFDAIRQMVQVVEDRTAFERWRAEERERLRAAGLDYDRLAYDPTRARPEADEGDAMHRERRKPPPPVPWDERAGQRFKRAVILGDPGFGKTWLLRYEARRLAREAVRQLREQTIRLDDLILPIFVRLSDVNQSNDPIRDALVTLAGAGRSDAFCHFVREKLSSDRCVILLDAWDEVPVEVPPAGQPLAYRPHHRQRLGQRLEAFARQFPQPRLLLTSRIVGYTASPIPDAQELELLAFDRPQIEAFVRIWFGDDAETAEQFLAMLRQNHQVRGLARIPLMLALMTRAYQDQQLDFPTRRVDLYDRCLRGLLRDWKERKEQREVSSAYVEAVLELLEAVGYKLFTEGHEQFSESLLRAAMATWLNSLPLTNEFYGRNPTSLIAELKRDGVFITAGEHRDAPLLFLHRTFHEYLTASALARRANSEGWPAIAGLVDRKAWLPVWQEVIVLLAGKLADQVPLIELLSDSDRDDLFQHRSCLAVCCLPELSSGKTAVPVARSQEAHAVNEAKLEKLTQWITESVLNLWWEHGEHGFGFQHIARSLPALAQSRSTTVLPAILERLQCSDSDLRCLAAQTLEVMGASAANLEVLTALAQSALDDGFVREDAARALRAMGVATPIPEVLDVLLQALLPPESLVHGPFHSEMVLRGPADFVLEILGVAVITPEMLDVLLRALGGSDPRVRWQAARALRAMGAVSRPEILLSEVFRPTGVKLEANRRGAEVGGLGAAATPEVLDCLVQALGDPDFGVRMRAAEALRAIGAAAATPETLNALIQALDGPNDSVHWSAAKALQAMGTAAATHEVLDALVQALGDPEWIVRALAAETLEAMGAAAATPKVRNALLQALDSPNDSVRWEAAIALIAMEVAAAPETLDALVQALQQTGNIRVRWRAAQALKAIAPHEILDTLVRALQDRNSKVRSQGAIALEAMGVAAATPEVLDVLIQVLDDPHENVRYWAAKAMAAMGTAAATPDILDVLLQGCLGDPDAGVRARAKKVLRAMGVAAATPGVLSTLVRVLGDPDDEVRLRGAIALEAMGTAAATPEILDVLLQALNDPNDRVRWQAATVLGMMQAAAVTPEVLAALHQALGAPDSRRVRWMAAKALGTMGMAAVTPEVLDTLVQSALGEAAAGFHESEAAAALRKMGPAAAKPKVLNTLVQALGDPDNRVRQRAARILETLFAQGVRVFDCQGRVKGRTVAELANE